RSVWRRYTSEGGMTAYAPIHAPASRANIEDAYRKAPPHLRPLIRAVRDNVAGLLFVGQGPQKFDLPRDPKRPAIIVIGDDFEKAVGPNGFDKLSIRRAVASACAFVVVSSGAHTPPYTAAALAAYRHRRNVLLVETRLEYEIA